MIKTELKPPNNRIAIPSSMKKRCSFGDIPLTFRRYSIDVSAILH